MHSFLVHTTPNISESPDVLHIHPDKSIGIEEVRSIQTFLSRKPFQSPQNTVLIHDAHLLTVPAQNALLKTLEEPPGASQIYLITSSPDLLLPTILSRIQIISSEYKSYVSDTSYASDLLNQLIPAKIGNRLQILETQEFTRETALKFIADLEWLIHSQLPLLTIDYSLLTKTRKFLQANCNLKLCLSHLAINL